MSASRASSPLASYRDEVTVLIGAVEPFGEVEDAIDELTGLDVDEQAALWLFAFSLDQEREARAQLTVVH